MYLLPAAPNVCSYTTLVSICPKGVYPLQFGVGEEVQGGTLTPNFTIVALRMWAYGPQNRQKW